MYMLVCQFGWTSLPFPFVIIQLASDDRLSASDAILCLIRRRWKTRSGRHVLAIADCAFSSRATRKLLTNNAVATDGVAIDLTVSLNSSWDKSLQNAFTHQLATNEYRLFYSPITESTVLVFKVKSKGKLHIITRLSNCYFDPRRQITTTTSSNESSPGIQTAPSRYTVSFAKKLLTASVEDLITLSADTRRLSMSRDAADIVHAITGVDTIKLQQEEDAFLQSDENITLPNGDIVSQQFLLQSTMAFLKSFCAK